MKKEILWVLAVVIIAGGWYIWSSKPKSTPSLQPGEQAGLVAQNTTVTYDGSSFSPSSVAIKKGGTVTFAGTSDMWVASNVHPSHEGYSGTTKAQHCPDTAGTAFDECGKGASYAFTFQKTGSWDYHDHANPAAGGLVNVVE
ncbi:MAG: hypothetical protein Q7S05_02515 [bacterium]|nr:hypothetical protein [bacterium]